MRTRRRLIVRLVILLCALLLGNLPSAPALASTHIYLPDMAKAGPLKATYNVTYQPNAVVIDDATMALLTAGNADSSEFRFKPTASAVGKLKAGQIVIFSGLAMGKVTSVVTSKTQIVVDVSATTLDKAIKDGSIGLDYGVDWTQIPLSSYEAMHTGPPGSELHLDSVSGFGADGLPIYTCQTSMCGAEDAAVPPVLSFSGKVSGWDVVMKLSPASNQLNLTLTGSNTIGNIKTSFSAKGFISNFSEETFINYQQSKLGEATVKSNGLAGELVIKWASVAPDGGFYLNDSIFLNIPLELPIPLRVGPIPVTLKLKAVVQIFPQMKFDTSSSGGSWKASYSSNQGLTFQGDLPNPIPSGGLQSYILDVDRADGETVSAGDGPAAFALGVEFPRVEVSIFNVTTAFVSIKTYADSIFLTEPPCQKGDITLAAYAGFKLNFLGASIGTDPTQLWQQPIHIFKDNKPC